MPDTRVHIEISGPVATITLNNPPLNVVSRDLSRRLGEALDAAAEDTAVRAVVLTGAGDRAFCAGSDISEFSEMMEPGQVIPKKLGPQNVIFNRLDDFPKPVVAALRGLVYGGGLEIAVCCDILVAEADARFCSPEIKLGLFPSSGGPVRVTRRVGEGRAKELMFLGEPIDAPTALSWGLINRVVPKGETLAAARAIATTLAERPVFALGLCKRAIDMSYDFTEEEAIRRALLLSDKAFSSPECREGVRAFFAKERPDFSRI